MSLPTLVTLPSFQTVATLALQVVLRCLTKDSSILTTLYQEIQDVASFRVPVSNVRR
jgi:hypothetical protein